MESEQRVSIEVLSRIISLETKLASTIDKLDTLIDSVDYKLNQYSGDAHTPSLISRVIQLEEFNKTIKWSLGIIYTAIVGLAANAFLKGRLP